MGNDEIIKYLMRMYHLRMPVAGSKLIFHNSSTGDNNNPGTKPTCPVLTVTQALALATDWGGDIILSRNIGTPAGETWPISVNKSDTTIIGWGEEANKSVNIVPVGDTAALSIAAHNITLIQLGFDAGINHAGIEFGVTDHWWSCLVKECWFGVQNAMQDGIFVVGGRDVSYLTVIDSLFGDLITRDGIRLEGSATKGQLGMLGHGNRFLGVPGIGIHAVNVVKHLQILDNRFKLPSNTAGKAITFAHAGSELGFIDGNHANFGKTAMAANPYVDAGTNTWGLNWKAGVSIMP